MNVLAIDTSLGALSAAVGHCDAGGDLIVTETYEETQFGHAERLMPMVQATMARAGLGFGDLKRIAVTLGPGTFTGVRTGIAAARAFRLATGLEVVGLTSLAVMAHRVLSAGAASGDPRPLLVAVDARRGGLYVQLFGADALEPLSMPQELTPAAAAALGGDTPLRAAGSGASAVAEAGRGRRRQIEVVAERLEPRAGDLAVLAPKLVPMDDIRPLYIRQPDAKPQTDKRLARTT
jgi:tRNA threonylcarbamoyladenosine biosynthesis protein TsaB